jgi:two-component system sensor histidine kinase HydH
MLNRHHPKRFRSAVPPWLVLGAMVVLLPVVTFMTIRNINREKEMTTRLLVEKGAALIRSFEAGTRTGMMGTGFQLQQLLTETARQADIAYLIVTDVDGTVIAHSDPDQVGQTYGTGLNLAQIARADSLQWRTLTGPDGTRTFEIYRRFSPIGRGQGMMQAPMMMHRRFQTPQSWSADMIRTGRIIFVGLDMSSLVEAQQVDIRHAVVMGVILLLVAVAGITLLFLAQSYRTTRASLSRIKAFSDNVVENMPIGLLALDTTKRIAACNHVAETTLQLTAENIIGKPAEKLLPGELWHQVERFDEQHDIVESEIDCTLPDKRSVPLEISASILRDEDNTILGCIILFKDLTEVRALRKEIARSQRLALVGRLAAGVAHEIRNPLSSIKGFATYFRDRYKEIPEDQQTAGIMIQEVDRLNRVVSQLLEFARPVSLTFRSTNLKELIDRSLKLIEKKASESNIEIRRRFPAESIVARVDPDRISQVLLNLSLNAVESMQHGGTLTASLSAADTGRQGIEIRVADTGCGIPAEQLSQIFDPYFTTKSSGTGLGLAIAHNIMEALGGRITVESRPGQGTCFAVFIPNRDEEPTS